MISNWTLTGYIARRFFLGIVTTFCVLALLIFMIDFVELLRQSGKYGEVAAGTLANIAALRLAAYTEFLLGFTVLVGSIGALLFLNRKSELAVMRGLALGRVGRRRLGHDRRDPYPGACDREAAVD